MSGISDELREIVERRKASGPRKSYGRKGKPTQEYFRGERLLALRNRWDLTQTDVGELLEVTRTTVTNIETGWQEPSLGTVVRIAKHFGVTTDWLLGLSDDGGLF